MAALAGAGAAVGGLSGALIGLGIPEYEAKQYEGKIKQGNILISVHSENGDEVSRAKDIFDHAARTTFPRAEKRAFHPALSGGIMKTRRNILILIGISTGLALSSAIGWSQSGSSPSSRSAQSKPSSVDSGSSKSTGGSGTAGHTGSGGSSVPGSSANCPDSNAASGLQQSPSAGSSMANKGSATSGTSGGDTASGTKSKTGSSAHTSLNCPPNDGTSRNQTPGNDKGAAGSRKNSGTGAGSSGSVP